MLLVFQDLVVLVDGSAVVVEAEKVLIILILLVVWVVLGVDPRFCLAVHTLVVVQADHRDTPKEEPLVQMEPQAPVVEVEDVEVTLTLQLIMVVMVDLVS
jgi:hypothetical protein